MNLRNIFTANFLRIARRSLDSGAVRQSSSGAFDLQHARTAPENQIVSKIAIKDVALTNRFFSIATGFTSDRLVWETSFLSSYFVDREVQLAMSILHASGGSAPITQR